MKRTGWIVLLALVFALLTGMGLLFACGGDDDDNDDNDDAADDDTDDDTGGDDTTGDDTTGDDTGNDPCDSPDVWCPGDGRMWQVAASEEGVNWSAAGTYCNDLTLAGFSEWVVPTISDLRSLIRECPATEPGGSCGVTDSCDEISGCWDSNCDGCSDGAGPNGCYWPSDTFTGHCNWYWSSTSVNDVDHPNYAWRVYFHSGEVNNAPKTDTAVYVRCMGNVD